MIWNYLTSQVMSYQNSIQPLTSSPFIIIRLIFFLLSLTSHVHPSTKKPTCNSNRHLNLTPGASSVQVPLMQSNGVNRSYLIHVPGNYVQDNPTSLIFSFHGRNKNSSYQEQITGLSRPEWNPDAIVVYPQGINNSWQGDPDSVDVDDIAFVTQMISSLSVTYCLDNRRIYATGKSNGAGFVNILACDAHLSTKIAAFAAVSGAFYIPGVNQTDCIAGIPQTAHFPCTPGRNQIPMMEFHGLNDDVIAYNGGQRRGACLSSILHWVGEWATREGFSSHDYKKTILYDGNVTKYEYTPNSESTSIITHYAIKNLGHYWPSVKPSIENRFGTYLDATPIIMDFLSTHTMKINYKSRHKYS